MRKTKAIIGLVVAFALMGLLAACGGGDPTPTSAPTATPVPAGDAFGTEWDELIAAAQAEGQVVLALGGSDSRTGRFAFAAFEKQFGVQIVASSGSGSDNANRILA